MRFCHSSVPFFVCLLLFACCLSAPPASAAAKQAIATQSKTRVAAAAPKAAKAAGVRRKTTGKATARATAAKARSAKVKKAGKKEVAAAKAKRGQVSSRSGGQGQRAIAGQARVARTGHATGTRIHAHALRQESGAAGLRHGAPVFSGASCATSLDALLKLSAKSFMVLDADTGRAIVAKNPDLPRQPASTIKIVTGLLAVQALGNKDRVPVSRHAASMPASKVNIQINHTYSADDMINSVLLASANDASVALAERIAGSEERFARMMTYNARRWGATNTVCRTASGLTMDGQQSTARDLAILFRHAMQNREFASRMHQRTAVTAFGRTLRNHNKALWKLAGAVAGKTGYTDAARQTYVGQFTRSGQTIVVAIMGSGTMWADLEKLVDYGFQQKKQEMARLRSVENM